MMLYLSEKIDKIPHAILLAGNDDKKKWEFLYRRIKQLLLISDFSNLSHPDLLILPVELEAALTIEDSRQVSRHLYQTSHQGGNKVVILKNCTRLSLGASQSLLKILEEPPEGCYIFLLSDYAHLLPLTIKSRCQKISFWSSKKNAESHIEALQLTLVQLNQKKLSVFDAAEKWHHLPLIEVLDGLFYCLLRQINHQPAHFYWYDLLNSTRRQVLHKHNPNQLLVLENLFYQWKQGNFSHDHVG